MKHKIAITSGDIDGIGAEVIAKALYKIAQQQGYQFIIWLQQKEQLYNLNSLIAQNRVGFVPNWRSFENLEDKDSYDFIFIEKQCPPCEWVEEVAQLAMEKKVNAMVTAPLSKTGIVQAGRNDIGHTEILKRISGAKDLFMTFLGDQFSVLLLTGHAPVAQAVESITEELTLRAIQLGSQFVGQLMKDRINKPMGLVGVNPHAGENGLLGLKENKVYTGLIKKVNLQGIPIEGPLVPDVCFQKKFWPSYSLYIASYHDQGLIPFKMVHSESGGVHITLGLPFHRTSVDHGTAKDIFGKGVANEDSMVKAIETALSLVQKKG